MSNTLRVLTARGMQPRTSTMAGIPTWCSQPDEGNYCRALGYRTNADATDGQASHRLRNCRVRREYDETVSTGRMWP